MSITLASHLSGASAAVWQLKINEVVSSKNNSGSDAIVAYGPSPRSLSARPLTALKASFNERLLGSKLSKSSMIYQNSFRGKKNLLLARAERTDGSREWPEKSLAPVSSESPAGQFLEQILQEHPHLFSAAVEKQIERLVEDSEMDNSQEQKTEGSTELVLYKRIAEVREEERRRALQEIMYTLIVQKFLEAGVSLVPKIPFMPADAPLTAVREVSLGPNKVKELEAVHSKEALEMVREHLVMIIGGRPVGYSIELEDRILVPTSKTGMGQVYAASIMYGYFLRRVDERFQLEKTMRALQDGNKGGLWEAFDLEPQGSGEEASGKDAPSGSPREGFQEHPELSADNPSSEKLDNLAAELSAAAAKMAATGGAGPLPGGNAGSMNEKISQLRAYVMSFDKETLQRAASMRTKEGINIIEKQTEALFGKAEVAMSPEGQLTVVNDQQIRVTLATLRHMVLEAVAFGSFLWDIESYVDSQYKLVRGSGSNSMN